MAETSEVMNTVTKVVILVVVIAIVAIIAFNVVGTGRSQVTPLSNITQQCYNWEFDTTPYGCGSDSATWGAIKENCKTAAGTSVDADACKYCQNICQGNITGK
jgi:hypothetical protein